MRRFDAPLAAGDLREVRGPGAVFFQAGDGVHDFLADQGAVEVVAVAADPCHLGRVREVQVPGAGDPDGAADDPAVAVVQFRVVRVAGAAVLDGVEDGTLQRRLVSLEEQEVIGAAVPVVLAARDVLRGLALGVGCVGGDHRVLQVHGVQQLFDLGGLGRLVRDAVLGDHHLLFVQHRGEQLDLPVRDAAQPLPVDRDRGRQPVQPAGVRQGAQPAPDQVIKGIGADGVDQGADPRLAGGDDPPQQRARLPAEPGQYLLRQVSGLVADLAEAPRPGQHARHRDGEHEHQGEPAPAPLPRIQDLREHIQQAGYFPGGAGHGGFAGMRH